LNWLSACWRKALIWKLWFITAYSQYALKAFHAHASGYLLKPLDIDEVREQIDNIVRRLGYRQSSNSSEYLRVKCLGQFLCNTDENRNEPIRWRTAKAEELFALLIHNHGKAISREILIDTPWPEAEPEKAASNFRVTCTYIRNTFEDNGITDILIRELNSYMLNCEKLCCDLFLFLSASSGIHSLERSAREEAVSGLFRLSFRVATAQRQLKYTVIMRRACLRRWDCSHQTSFVKIYSK